MNAEQMNVIKERAENTSFDNAYVKGDPWKGYEVKAEGYGYIIAEVPCKADADFIAHAREDIPQLIAEVERLQNELTSAKEYADYRIKYSEQLSKQLAESYAENERLQAKMSEGKEE